MAEHSSMMGHESLGNHYFSAPSLAPAVAYPRGYRFRGWELNLNNRKLLSPEGAHVKLTKTEFELLLTFLAQPQKIMSREQILDSTRALDEIYDRAIDVQILRLRRKIEVKPRTPAILKTVRGAGYYFDGRVEQVH